MSEEFDFDIRPLGEGLPTVEITMVVRPPVVRFNQGGKFIETANEEQLCELFELIEDAFVQFDLARLPSLAPSAKKTAPAAVPPSGERTEAAATGVGKETGARRNQRPPERDKSPS